ncbi:MAG: glutathione S-transferase family protein [Myxococcota bacterium]
MELYEFRFSTYNEKVRWALALKGIAWEPRTQLPGLHMKTLTAVSGQTSTPVLVDDDDVIAGSAAILAHLDARHPDPPLLSSDPAEREETLSWQRWLDDEVGPPLRYALFADVLDDSGFAGRVFSLGVSGFKAAAYRGLYPFMKGMLKKKLAFTEEAVTKAQQTVTSALNRYADRLRTRPYLVGDRFGAADLAAASIFFPICFPDELPIDVPRERASIQHWMARWKDHDALEHIRRIYRDHR